MTSTWDLVHAERRALVTDLSTLTDEQWAQPSLCQGWSVHDVAAHLVDNAKATPWGVIVAMARARFDFDRHNDEGMLRERGASTTITLERLRQVAGRTTGPPAPVASRLVEEVLHGEDIRRPLRLRHDYLPQAVEQALRYQANTSVGFGGGRQVAQRVCLRADDTDLVLGDGPEVHGPALALLMVISGRRVALADLGGPGVSLLG